MAKIFLSELSAVLAEKHGIDRRTAQRFVTSVVSVVQSGLEADRIVKIKGLGTFKIIDVEARESVNVNTGERLVIDSHSKLTFLPDNTMKELVNRPFSQFETVVLNDGVNFDEPEEETPATDAEEGSTATVEIEEEEATAPAVEEGNEATAPIVEEEAEETVPVVEKEEDATTPVVEKVEEATAPVIEEEDVEEQKTSPVETIQTVVDMPEKTDVEEEKKEIALPPGWKTSEEVDDDSSAEQIVSTKRKFGWGHLAAISLIALLVGGGAGYLLGHELGDSTSAPSENITPQVEQTTPQNEQPQVAEEQSTTEEAETEPQEVEDSTTPIWEKYDGMDPRTHNGYYYITGLDRTEKAKAGDTSARLARRYFGAVELACYIEVFNGIDGRTVLEEDAEVKIPKIEPKKNVRKRLQQQNNQQ